VGGSLNEALWQPAVSVELSALELMDLVDADLLRAANAARTRQHEVQQFHETRAGALRQTVATIAPHLLAPKEADST